MARVAVVEDNQDLLDDVMFNLERAGFSVRGCARGEALDAIMQNFQPQVVILDIGLPGEDGLSIAMRLRAARPTLGIVMLTARTMLEDRIAGHRLGADNYLCKPVEMEELVAVVGARARSADSAAVQEAFWTFNAKELSLQAPTGERLPLTHTEYQILATLIATPGQQACRADLIRALGGNPDDYDIRRLEVAISRLRQKIRAICPNANPVRALRNQGYAFVAPVRAE